ncbi:MAG TPA: hypothetical protein VIC71_05645 [Gammaproteobacteria bacterium]|jgi:hypothetical protein
MRVAARCSATVPLLFGLIEAGHVLVMVDAEVEIETVEPHAPIFAHR